MWDAVKLNVAGKGPFARPIALRFDRSLSSHRRPFLENCMPHSTRNWIHFVIAAVFYTGSVQGQSPPDGAQPVPGYPHLLRHESCVYVAISDAQSEFPSIVPRFAAAVRSVTWLEDRELVLELTPEVDSWVIKPRNVELVSGAGHCCIELASEAILMDELEPQLGCADGSIFLPAHDATVTGKRLRYEPQPHKNTIGYWTEAADSASWRFLVDQPGKFNVSILQGCGAGQGGSQAQLSIRPLSQAQSDNAKAGPALKTSDLLKLDFEVMETGHFQNFQWRHLTSIHLAQAGTHELSLMPVAIRKAALMDVRAIHLIRVPD